MRRFRFKFETLLKQRKAREEIALRALADAQREYHAHVAVKTQLEKDLEVALIRRENLGQSAIGIVAFLTEQDYITGTKQRIIQAQHAIVRASRSVEKSLRTYLHARRQTKTIEMLYEKHFLEYKREAKKRETKELEDLVVMRAGFRDEEEEVA